jgi:hypothetical protein
MSDEAKPPNDPPKLTGAKRAAVVEALARAVVKELQVGEEEIDGGKPENVSERPRK